MLELDGYLELLDSISNKMADYMINEMRTHSIKNPAMVENFKLSSSGNAIGKLEIPLPLNHFSESDEEAIAWYIQFPFLNFATSGIPFPSAFHEEKLANSLSIFCHYFQTWTYKLLKCAVFLIQTFERYMVQRTHIWPTTLLTYFEMKCRIWWEIKVIWLFFVYLDRRCIYLFDKIPKTCFKNQYYFQL